jgi:hypothetical protein
MNEYYISVQYWQQLWGHALHGFLLWWFSNLENFSCIPPLASMTKCEVRGEKMILLCICFSQWSRFTDSQSFIIIMVDFYCIFWNNNIKLKNYFVFTLSHILTLAYFFLLFLNFKFPSGTKARYFFFLIILLHLYGSEIVAIRPLK